MLPGDAYLWARHRDDEELMQKFKEFTQEKFSSQRGFYGQIGDRTVIKNTSIIKDVWIGTDAYIKGANKLKNLTINSSAEAPSQIGEGCELVNGIIDYGCRIFYGVKAVRFVLASQSQLKYGARLINSYLGNNSTISCCEVLNSLIFPAHEQHHNNSFLCAAMIMGQSNIAAGATIGSNHNSRAADGELVTARGFWPGLCVSLKHNSKFATFTLIAKGDYSAELNIPLPFSLVSNDESNNQLIVRPAYWFMYNLYALARNEGKYASRDVRIEKIQHFEYEYLAPDSINEVFTALQLLRKFVALAYHPEFSLKETPENILIDAGEELLNDFTINPNSVPVKAYGFENSTRPVQLLKVKEAYDIYKRLVMYYGTSQLLRFMQLHNIDSFEGLTNALPEQPTRLEWVNVGGQLMPAKTVESLFGSIKSEEIKNWDGVHEFYSTNAAMYNEQKLQHAFASLIEILQITKAALTKELYLELLQDAVETRQWMTNQIYQSRAKDYQNEFRQMVYNNEKEMDIVLGRLEDNVFINQQQEELEKFRTDVDAIATALA
jgi:hypothetical protein